MELEMTISTTLVGFVTGLCIASGIVQADQQPPVARWTETPYAVRGDDFIVTLSAEHFSGIKKVVFTLDGETEFTARRKRPHPMTKYPEYLFPVGDLEDGVHEVTATIYANSGATLTLEGDARRFGDLNVRNNGLNSYIFRTGEYEDISVGPNGDFPSIDAAFASGDIRGKRLILEPGEYRGLSATYGKRLRTVGEPDPVVIQGGPGVSFSGRFGSVYNTSVIFRDITFKMPLRESGGDRWIRSSRKSNEMVAWEGCLFTPDSDDPLSWRQIEWLQYTDMQFHAGVFSIANTFYKVSTGLARVTLSKGDSMEYRIWDAFTKNPGAVLDFYDNKSTGNGAIDGPGCGNSALHGDIIQFWNPAPLEEYGPTRNRLFVDITSMNMDYQVAHFEGDWRKDENGVKPAAAYADWYLARWVVDSKKSSSSMNFASSGAPVHYRNITLEDMTFSRASIDVGFSNHVTYEGLRARQCITYKWRKSGVCPDTIFDEIEGWHVETTSKCDEGLSVGPVDWADRDPAGPREYTCDGGYWNEVMPDLSNSVFTANTDCYTLDDVASAMSTVRSSDMTWDLNGDGRVSGKDIQIIYGNLCTR